MSAATAAARPSSSSDPDPAVVADAPRPCLGRPRSSEADAAIIAAALELFAESGYEALSIEAVAEAAGVAKSTVYRRYAGKAQLVIAAIDGTDSCGPAYADELPETGTIEGDAFLLLAALRDTFASEAKSRIIPALTGAAARHPELAEPHARFIASRRAPAIRLVNRAIERGELPVGTDPELIVDLLVAPVYYRSFVSSGFLGDDALRAIARTVLDHAR